MTTPATHPLFDLIEENARERLIGSAFGGLLPNEAVADLFCGAGGWGEGLKRLGGSTVGFAINHSPVAIEIHTANNPGCRHHQGDAWKAKPRSVVGRAKLGILFASAACTTHSRARGSAPISKRVHMLGWCIARWAKELKPRVVMVENVVEWQGWGPTKVVDGVRRQDPERAGQHFRRWWRYMERLGYVMEMRVLDAADFGSASRRKRLFVIARRDGAPIVWPERTHGQVVRRDQDRGVRSDVSQAGGQRASVGLDAEVRGPLQAGRSGEKGNGASGCRNGESARGDQQSKANGGRKGLEGARSGLIPYRTAADVIDWSDLGTSIFERKRPLRPKTLGRIAEGIRRYVLQDPQPYILRVTHGEGRGWAVSPVEAPLPTQTTRQDLAVCTPVVQVIRGDVCGRDVRDPLPTVTAGNGPGRGAGAGHAMGLATPILATTGYGERDGQAARVHQVAELLGTCVDGVKQGIASAVVMPAGGPDGSPAPVTEPYRTVLTRDHCGVAVPVMAYLNHGGKQSGPVGEPLRTVVGGGGHSMLVAALLTSFYGNNKGGQSVGSPMGTVTTLDRHGLVVCVLGGAEYVVVDILFRMLRPYELAAAMGFPADFKWPKTQRDTVRCIGNAVSVDMAEALIGSVMPGLRRERKECAA